MHFHRFRFEFYAVVPKGPFDNNSSLAQVNFRLKLYLHYYRRAILQCRHNERDGVSNLSRLLAQPFVQVQIKENIKAPHHWPFVRGIHR